MRRKLDLFSLAWPIFVENFLAKLLGMVNVFLLSRYSEEAVAAIGVSNQFINFITMLFSFVTFGSAIVISQNLGADRRERAASAASVAVMLNVGVGVLVGLIVLFFHRPLLSMMNMEGKLMDYSAVYLTTIGGLCALQGLNLSLATIMRNYGHTRPPMMVFLGMNVLNLIGNCIIIYRPFGLPDLGIGGIAACTVISQGLAAVAMVAAAIRYKISLRLEKPFRWNVLKEILRIGIPGAGDGLAYNLAQIALTYFVTSLGATALATMTYTQNLIAFVQLLGYSVGQAAQIVVGYHVGAGDYEYAYKLGYRGTFIAIALNLAVMTLLFALQRPLLSLLTNNPEIFKVAFWVFVVDFVLEVGRPFNLVIGTTLRGAGDVNWAIVASVASILLVCIPLGYLCTQVFHLGVPGIFIALAADEWLRGQLMQLRWHSRKWEKAALVKQAAA